MSLCYVAAAYKCEIHFLVEIEVEIEVEVEIGPQYLRNPSFVDGGAIHECCGKDGTHNT